MTQDQYLKIRAFRETTFEDYQEVFQIGKSLYFAGKNNCYYKVVRYFDIIAQCENVFKNSHKNSLLNKAQEVEKFVRNANYFSQAIDYALNTQHNTNNFFLQEDFFLSFLKQKPTMHTIRKFNLALKTAKLLNNNSIAFWETIKSLSKKDFLFGKCILALYYSNIIKKKEQFVQEFVSGELEIGYSTVEEGFFNTIYFEEEEESFNIDTFFCITEIQEVEYQILKQNQQELI